MSDYVLPQEHIRFESFERYIVSNVVKKKLVAQSFQIVERRRAALRFLSPGYSKRAKVSAQLDQMKVAAIVRDKIRSKMDFPAVPAN